MIVDTSAMIALITGEPDAPEVLRHLVGAEAVRVPAPSATETVIVLTARIGPAGRTAYERVRHELDIEVMPYTAEHVPLAHRAYLAYGKGRHPAALNFGDCMVYAVARVAAEPLLAVGDDFRRTDLQFDGIVGHWRRPA